MVTFFHRSTEHQRCPTLHIHYCINLSWKLFHSTGSFILTIAWSIIFNQQNSEAFPQSQVTVYLLMVTCICAVQAAGKRVRKPTNHTDRRLCEWKERHWHRDPADRKQVKGFYLISESCPRNAGKSHLSSCLHLNRLKQKWWEELAVWSLFFTFLSPSWKFTCVELFLDTA